MRVTLKSPVPPSAVSKAQSKAQRALMPVQAGAALAAPRRRDPAALRPASPVARASPALDKLISMREELASSGREPMSAEQLVGPAGLVPPAEKAASRTARFVTPARWPAWASSNAVLRLRKAAALMWRAVFFGGQTPRLKPANNPSMEVLMARKADPCRIALRRQCRVDAGNGGARCSRGGESQFPWMSDTGHRTTTTWIAP